MIKSRLENLPADFFQMDCPAQTPYKGKISGLETTSTKAFLDKDQS